MVKMMTPDRLDEIIKHRKELRNRKKGRESVRGKMLRLQKSVTRLRNEWKRHMMWCQKFSERADKLLDRMERLNEKE